MEKLMRAAAAVLTYTWTAHLNMKGPQFWSYHKMFDKIYHDAIETVDRICESAVEKGLYALPTVEAENLGTSNISELIGNTQIIIRSFLAILKECEGIDEGTDNMIGDLSEKWSHWANFMLASSIGE